MLPIPGCIGHLVWLGLAWATQTEPVQGVQQYNVPGDTGHLARMAALEAARQSAGEPGELVQRSSGLSASGLSASFLGALGQQRRATSQVTCWADVLS